MHSPIKIGDTYLPAPSSYSPWQEDRNSETFYTETGHAVRYPIRKGVWFIRYGLGLATSEEVAIIKAALAPHSLQVMFHKPEGGTETKTMFCERGVSVDAVEGRGQQVRWKVSFMLEEE